MGHLQRQRWHPIGCWGWTGSGARAVGITLMFVDRHVVQELELLLGVLCILMVNECKFLKTMTF